MTIHFCDKFIYGGTSDVNGSHIDGCIKNGISAEVASKIFADMEGFASYAFNKSHAAAYATLAYQTAWLKKYYIKEFICALLNNRLNKIEEITKYVLYLKEKGLKVFPPDINRSKTVFSVENDGVRFGLSALRGTGQAVIDLVIDERNKNGLFEDFGDFMSRCASLVNKRVIEGLIYAGAFDSFGVHRSQLILVYDSVYQRAASIAKQKNSAQMSLFGDIIAEEKLEVRYPDVPEYELNEKLAKEKEVLGVYVSGHPFEKYMNSFSDCNFNCSLLDDYTEDDDGERTYNSVENGMRVTMGGIITAYKKTTTKRTGAHMAFVTLEDVYGSIECLAFPAIYERYRGLIVNDKIVRISGKLDLENGKEPTIILDNIAAFDSSSAEGAADVPKAEKKKRDVLWLNATRLSDDDFDELVSMLGNYEGETDCAIKRGDKRFRLDCGVNYCRGLLAELSTFLDEADVKLV